jgi:hypothetical protein
MRNTRMQGRGLGSCSIAAMVGSLVLSLGGCASESAKPAPTLSPDHVRGNADRTFEKLKQDEKNRVMPPGASY